MIHYSKLSRDTFHFDKAPDTRAVTTARRDWRCFLAAVVAAVTTGIVFLSHRRKNHAHFDDRRDGTPVTRPVPSRDGSCVRVLSNNVLETV